MLRRQPRWERLSLFESGESELGRHGPNQKPVHYLALGESSSGRVVDASAGATMTPASGRSFGLRG